MASDRTDEQTEHSGGMVALIPSDVDAQRLAVASGESPEDLHTTVFYLGDDVTGWDPEIGADLIDALTDQAEGLGPISAHVFGHALFNPDGGPDGDREPCAVYLIGEAPDLAGLRDYVQDYLADEPIPDQHDPYVPHITAGYGLDAGALSESGPITFDRLRVALGDNVVDIPLGGLDNDEAMGVDVPEVKVMSPDPRAAKLRAYWARGAGRKKWRPGQPGAFTRLRRELVKYVPQPNILNGLTANIYKLATGTWPGRHGQKALLLDDTRIADDDTAFEAALCEGIDGWGAHFGDEDVEGFDFDPLDDDMDADGTAAAVVAEAMEGKAALLDDDSFDLDRFFDMADSLDTDDGDDAQTEDTGGIDEWAEVVESDVPHVLDAHGQLILDSERGYGRLDRPAEPARFVYLFDEPTTRRA